MSECDSTHMNGELPVIDNVEFRLVPFDNRYAVGSDGSLWSRRGRVKESRRNLWFSWEQRRPWIHKSGHLYVRLSNSKNFQVHRLVALAFHGEPNDCNCECRHLNGIPTDNRPENLRWGTRSENLRDNVRHGVGSSRERHHLAKLTSESVRAIRELRRRHPGYSRITPFLARWFGVSQPTITEAALGRTWNDDFLRM